MKQNLEIKEILLVDDEEDIREVLSIALMDLGYEVSLAENGQKALELFEKTPFEIVLTDIKMPGMDGIELLKRIKKNFPETEIIMITGHGDMDLAIESFRNEAVEFITKPVDVRVLEIAINRAKEKIELKKHLLNYTHGLERLVQQKTEEIKTVREKPKSMEEITGIMDTLPMVIFCVNDKLRLTSYNALFKQQFGDHPNSPCHRVCKRSAIACEDCPALKSFISRLPEQAEVTYITKNHNEVSFLAWASPVEKYPGTISEVMIMATDISRIIDIEDHLKSLGLMIGSVSHGIKGLLTGLDGGLYLLDSALKKEDQDQAKEGLETMKLMTSKIRKMILDILFYTKNRELKKEPISATKFAKEIIQTVKSRIEAANIVLTQELPLEEIEFMADSGQLHSAIINIFDNAIDACVEKSEQKNHAIGFTIRQKNNEVEFVISDTGIGMNKDEIKQAFTLFHSGKGKKGTGLGLFIAEKIITQHMGTIKAKSEPGKGSTFYISLPLA